MAITDPSSQQFETPEFLEKCTAGAQLISLPDFEVKLPFPVLARYAHGLGRLASNRALHRAQQVLFLPCFLSTDHIFHGEVMDSDDPREGFPTHRPGIIRGANFQMTLFETLRPDSRYLSFGAHADSSRMLSLYLQPGTEREDSQLVHWLDEDLLTPLRDELMLYTPPEDEDLND